MKQWSRKEKIALLTALYNGKATLSDLQPESEAIWNHAGGLYYLGFGGKALTQSEFEHYTKIRPKQRNVIFTLADGYELKHY